MIGVSHVHHRSLSLVNLRSAAEILVRHVVFQNIDQSAVGSLRFPCKFIVGYYIPIPNQTDFTRDRKSTRLNSSHVAISYAVSCLKKKKRPTASAGECAI